MPSHYLKDGVYIFQYAQATDTADTTLDKISIACVVQVGNPEGTVVRSYRGSNVMSPDTMSSLPMEEINYDDWEQQSDIEAPRDASSYELADSDLDVIANRIQKCSASLKIDNTNRDTSLYGTFDVTIGARVYASRDDTEPVDLGTTDFVLTIDEPVIDYEDWEPSEGFGDIERETQIM